MSQTPRLSLNQSMSVLRLPIGDLADLIRAAARANPLLILRETAPPPGLLRPCDLLVTVEGRGTLSVVLNEAALPHVSLDAPLIARMQAEPAARAWLKSNVTGAQQLIRALTFRNKTLLATTRAIVSHQRRFFLDGPDYLAPLTRARIAQRLSLHPSTVGRTIAGKALSVNDAVYPLVFFMSPALDRARHKRLSAYIVQRAIRRLIEHEPDAAPLSDDAIVQKLRMDGVDIARRTVAKYRGCLNIPSSLKRRQLKAAQRTPPPSQGRG